MMHLGDQAVVPMLHDAQPVSIDLTALCVDGIGWWNHAWTNISGMSVDANWSWSTWIPVGPGKIEYYAYMHQSVGHFTAWTAAGTELGCLTGTTSGRIASGEWELPAGTQFLRICIANPEGSIGSRYDQRVTFVGDSPLPRRYRLLDYIESTGTQYIDTGVAPTADLLADLRFTLTEPDGDSKVFGMYSMSGAFLGCYDSKYRIGSGLKSSSIATSSSRTRAVNSRSTWDVGGTSDTATAVAANAETMLLFASRFGGTGQPSIQYGKMRAHEVLLMKSSSSRPMVGTSVTACLMPCLDLQTGRLGMFDTVAGALRPNLGAGQFGAGPAVA